MAYLLALDQGTSSSRSIVFDAQGRIVAQAQRPLAQHFPQPGWVEHDGRAIWRDQLDTAREALDRAGIAADAVAALGITNQRETTLIWDRATGQPIHHAIVWQDRRTEPHCARLRQAGHEPLLKARTGLVVDAYFSATKIAWLLDEVPGARAKAARGELAFGTVDSWLLWQLTGGRLHATDVSNASRTLLFDLHTGDWSDALLALFDIPRTLMPQVLPSSSRAYGNTAPGLLGAPVPIGGVAGDQQAALFGQGCHTAGMAKNTYGTGCFLLMHTGASFQPSAHGLITTAACSLAEALPRAGEGAGGGGPRDGPRPPSSAFALEGSVFVGGAVVQWLRDGLHAVESSAQVEQLAASVPDAGGVAIVPAFTGLGAPYWRPDARGTITGLTRGSTLAHIARAALESIACQSAALLAAMQADAQAAGAPALTALRVDGGASVNDLLMQFQADLLGIPVERPAVTETTALGAAWLAGLAWGVFPDASALAAQWRAERVFEPRWDAGRRAERMAQWEHAVRQATAP